MTPNGGRITPLVEIGTLDLHHLSGLWLRLLVKKEAAMTIVAFLFLIMDDVEVFPHTGGPQRTPALD